MRTAYKKVLRDLWRNKGRTVLVVLSIAVGVMAVGMILSSLQLMNVELTRSQLQSQPSHAFLMLDGLASEDTVNSLERIPGIAAAEGEADRRIQWKPFLDAEWQDAILTAIDNYEEQAFDLRQLKSGSWPDSKSIAVEWNHQIPFGIPDVGETIYIEVNGRAKPIKINGTLRDPVMAGPPFSTEPSLYASRELMEQLVGNSASNQVRFTLVEYSKEEAERLIELAEDKLARQGLPVYFAMALDPERHWAQDVMDGVGLVLTVMAIASLFLSAILVINTINALIAQQIPQIGIMKTVGGVRRQITQIYLAGVVVYCALALLIAVPLGALFGHALAQWMFGILNIPQVSLTLVPSALLIQLIAGLMVPLLASMYPVLRGVGISVREAVSRYGVGSGKYGTGRLDRIMASIRGLPRMIILALRNTFRRMGRVALTEIVLVTAGAIFIMVVSTQYSFSETIADIWRGLGFDAFVVFEGMQREDEIVPHIESRENVDLVEMWIFYSGNAHLPGTKGAGNEERVSLFGVPRDTQLYEPKLLAGRKLHPEDGHAILMNQKMAEELGLSVGDQVAIDLEKYGTSEWTIVGLVFDLTNNQTGAYVHADTLGGEINQIGRGSVAEIKAVDDSLAAQMALKEDLENYLETQGIGINYARSSAEDRQEAEAQFNVLTTVLMIMTILMAVVGSIGLSGTLSINVIERRREIGVMRAVGASSKDVSFIFIAEGLFLGAASWLQAVPLGIIAGKPFVKALGDIIDFPGQYQLAFHAIWIWLVIVMLLALFASWLPARRASQISVNESLSYE